MQFGRDEELTILVTALAVKAAGAAQVYRLHLVHPCNSSPTAESEFVGDVGSSGLELVAKTLRQ